MAPVPGGLTSKGRFDSADSPEPADRCASRSNLARRKAGFWPSWSPRTSAPID